MKKIMKFFDVIYYYAIFVTHNDTSAMNYVLKDHIGSLYATITDGEVEYYRLSPLAFSQFFANMNGRMYDPLVGRMLTIR